MLLLSRRDNCSDSTRAMMLTATSQQLRDACRYLGRRRAAALMLWTDLSDCEALQVHKGESVSIDEGVVIMERLSLGNVASETPN